MGQVESEVAVRQLGGPEGSWRDALGAGEASRIETECCVLSTRIGPETRGEGTWRVCGVLRKEVGG